MPVYLVYMLKASVSIAVIYLFYFIFIKRITYYTCNRYFLLAYSVLACIIPCINVSVFVEEKQLNNVAFINRLPSLQTFVAGENNAFSATGFAITNLLFIVFIVGFFVMFIRFCIQLFSLWRMHLKATLLQDGEVKLYNLKEPIVPFSFFNNIYINKDNYSDDELTEIVKHELVHVQQNHTIDILITEFICLLNWYNPFAWLVKKAVKENLEFIADDVVVRKGVDKKNYQYLLLKTTGNVGFSIANNLNFSSLKNRISMMNKSKTNRLHLLKFALLVPVATILLLAFRNKHEVHINKGNEQDTITKTYILSSLTYAIPDKKIESVVKKEQDKCLLKTGEALNLDLVFKERIRLNDLLEKNGYSNIGKHAIRFMIDTTLGNNSFSIQVNINLAKDEISESKEMPSKNNQLNTPANNTERLTSAIMRQKPNNIIGSPNVNNLESSSVNTMDNSKISAIN